MIHRLTPVALAATLVFPAHAQTQATAADLPTVVVTGNRSPYVLPATRSATRTDTPVEQVPQSIVVLPKSLIEDQGARTLTDVLRNASNVNDVDERDANNVPFKIRGFTAATVVDGVAMPGYFGTQESLVNVERLDIVKGPAGDLFGSSQGLGSYGSLGGTVAITTAEPDQTARRRVQFRLGSQRERGVGFDVNQPLGADWAVRLVGEASDRRSETDQVFFRRRALAPSLVWAPSADTKVVLKGRYLDNTTLDYSGLPLNGTLDTSTYTLPRRTMVAATDQPDTTNTSQGIHLHWMQRLTPAWTFDLTLAHQQAKVDQRGSWLVDPTGMMGCFGFGTATPATNILCGARMWDRFKTTSVSPSLTGRIEHDGVRHTLSAGLDLERTKDDAFMIYSNLMGPIAMDNVSLVGPTAYPVWSEPLEPATPDQQNRYTSRVVYLQDQMDIGDWHLLGSLRHSRIDVTDINPAWGVSNVSRNHRTTPRVGAVYDVTPQVSLFAGYAEGIKVPTVSVFSTPPKPEEGQQKELGLRLKDFHGLSATIAVFDLSRRNAAVGDPTQPGKSIQTGLQRSKGVDIDLRWRFARGWTGLAALTSQQARIVEDTNAALVDKWLFNVPQKSARLALRYDAPEGAWSGFGAGLGMTYRGRLAGDNVNSFFTPAATVWDAQVSWRTEGARYGVGVGNLFDRQFYKPSAYFSGGQVTPAQGRTVTASAQFDF